MTDGYGDRVRRESESFERSARRDGVDEAVTLRWNVWRESPPGPDHYRIEVRDARRMPVFGSDAEDLDLALRVLRRRMEDAGYRLGVEGARRTTAAAAAQEPGALGLAVVRMDDNGIPLRGDAPRELFDALDPAETATVLEQQAWRESLAGGPVATERRVVTSSGPGWRIVSCTVARNARVWVPDGYLGHRASDRGQFESVAFTSRLGALAASTREPHAVSFAAFQNSGGLGWRLDPGSFWQTSTVHSRLERLSRRMTLTRLELWGRDALRTHVRNLIGATDVFQASSRAGGGLLVRLPPGSDREEAGDRLLAEIGSSLFPPLILVVAGEEPAPIHRALEAARPS